MTPSGPSGDARVEAEVAEHFRGAPVALAAYRRVREVLTDVDGVEVRVSRSQVALRRRRGFAWLWLPGRYLAHPRSEVVLSVALARRDPSPRWAQVAHPAPRQWVHHLDVNGVDDVDGEVGGWLHEAAARA
jgi:hypothetical protein